MKSHSIFLYLSLSLVSIAPIGRTLNPISQIMTTAGCHGKGLVYFRAVSHYSVCGSVLLTVLPPLGGSDRPCSHVAPC